MKHLALSTGGDGAVTELVSTGEDADWKYARHTYQAIGKYVVTVDLNKSEDDYNKAACDNAISLVSSAYLTVPFDPNNQANIKENDDCEIEILDFNATMLADMLASVVSPFMQYKVRISNRLFHSLKKSKNYSKYSYAFKLCHICSPTRDFLPEDADIKNYSRTNFMNRNSEFPNIEDNLHYPLIFHMFNDAKLLGLKNVYLNGRGLNGSFSYAKLKSLNVTHIDSQILGPSTFQFSSLEDISIPSSVLTIDKAFYNCQNLSSIVGTENVTLLTENTFKNCTSLLSANFPALTSCISNTFSNCSSLRYANFSSMTIDTWPSALLKDSKDSLEELDASNMTEFYNSEFSGFKNLKKVISPNLTFVNDSLFGGCFSLSSIDTQSIEHIGNESFIACSSLIDLELPNCLDIGYGAFVICRSLSSISAPLLTGLPDNETFSNCTNLVSVDFPELVYAGSDSWCTHFHSCTSLTGVNFPKLKEVPKGMFYNCSSLEMASFQSATFIDSDVFEDCLNLKDVYLPSIEALTGGYPFVYCVNLSGLHVPNCHTFGNVFGWAGNSIEVTDFPAGRTFKNTFNNWRKLKFANLPNAEYIDSFSNCASLTGIYAPKLTEFGDYFFNNCTSLSSISHSLVSSLGSACFWFCSSLSSVDLPNLSSIGGACFYACSSLQSFDMPVTMNNVPAKAFYGTGLTDVDWPSIYALDNQCFKDCKSLSSVSLPALTGIGPSAFYGCESLHDLELASSVQSIGDFAFYNSSLSSLTINSAPSDLSTKSFKRNDQDTTLTVNFLCDESEVTGYPWDASLSNTIFLFNGVPATGAVNEKTALEILDEEHLKLHMPFKENANEVISNRSYNVTYGSLNNITYQEFNGYKCASIPATFGIQYTSSQLNGLPTSNDISMSFWFSPKGNAGNFYTYIRLGQKTNDKALNLAGRYNSKIYGGVEGEGDIGRDKGDTADITNQVGNWYHHVITYNKSTNEAKVYLNNVLKGSVTVPNFSLTYGSDGLRLAYTNRQCDARYIRDFRIYDCCLTPEEIGMLYELTDDEPAEDEELQPLSGDPADNEIYYYSTAKADVNEEAGVDKNEYNSERDEGRLTFNSSITKVPDELFKH